MDCVFEKVSTKSGGVGVRDKENGGKVCAKRKIVLFQSVETMLFFFFALRKLCHQLPNLHEDQGAIIFPEQFQRVITRPIWFCNVLEK